VIPYKFLFLSHGFTNPPKVEKMDLDPVTLTTIIFAAFEAAESPLPQLLVHRQRHEEERGREHGQEAEEEEDNDEEGDEEPEDEEEDEDSE
jgi:hypothetical protein